MATVIFEKRYSFTELDNLFSNDNQGLGIKSQKVDKREHLDQAIGDWLNSDGPALLEVVVENEENVFPMVPSGASVSDIRLD